MSQVTSASASDSLNCAVSGASVGILLFFGCARRAIDPCYGNGMVPENGLDGLFEPLSRCLDAESARRVVELQLAPSVQERIDTLATRANEGALSENEHSEYEALINASDFISILKLKALRYLRPE